ncbi:SRPBCC family protein [Micromonospora zhanjiangensis]|uniref:SRPBCC family protein n=1 Tax=Micromonospora zhanjiangensis TaxID=1522057 RepID=A0ABV8KEE5_9ACTN
MSTVAVSKLVRASVGEIWRAFTDLPARGRYLSTVETVEVLTPGPFGTGTRWRETRSLPDGTRVTEEYVVNEVVPRVLCAITSPGVGADYRITYRFTPVDVGRRRGGTVVTVVQDGGPTAPYGRFLALMFGGLAARSVESALRCDLADLAVAAQSLGADPTGRSAEPTGRPGGGTDKVVDGEAA